MTVLVSLLRGVNVGGRTRLKMAELVELCRSLGFTDVKTYVQSGNIVFSHSSRTTEEIARQIENRLRSRLNLDVTVIVRTPAELGIMINRNPFKKHEPNRVHVTFLAKKPASIPSEKIQAARTRGEEFSVQDREVYLYAPNGYGRSKLSNSFFERVLDVRATTRNWNTVTALLNMSKQARSSSQSDQE